MNCLQELDRLLETIKAAPLPFSQLLQLDEDSLPCTCHRSDLFEQLVESEPDAALPHFCRRKSPPPRQLSPRPVLALQPESDQYPGCKCSKIDCLKLYCQCFARGRTCGPKCICVGCGNNHANHNGIYQAQRVANFRNPGHFHGVPAYVPGRKCTCKKSSCRKNYCECFRAGVSCGEECQCIDCRNGRPHSHHNPPHHQSFNMDLESMEIVTMA